MKNIKIWLKLPKENESHLFFFFSYSFYVYFYFYSKFFLKKIYLKLFKKNNKIKKDKNMNYIIRIKII